MANVYKDQGVGTIPVQDGSIPWNLKSTHNVSKCIFWKRHTISDIINDPQIVTISIITNFSYAYELIRMIQFCTDHFSVQVYGEFWTMAWCTKWYYSVVCNSKCIIHYLNEIIFFAFLHCIITSIYLLNVSIPNANALQCLYVYSALINCPIHFQNRQSSIVKCSYALQFINYSYVVSTKVLLTSLLLH